MRLSRPHAVGEEFPTARASRPHVKPGQETPLSNTYRHEDPSVETSAARVEALEAVDGRQAGRRRQVEGEKLAVHASDSRIWAGGVIWWIG